MHIETSALFRRCCLAFVLTATAQVFAAGTTLGADAWVSEDLMRQLLVIHQPPPTPAIPIRAPSALRMDLNVDAAVLCARHLDHMWLMDLASRRLVRSDIPEDSAVPRPQVAVSLSGCATPASDTTLLILDKSGQTVTTRLKLPPDMAQFDWRSLVYDDTHEVYLATGAQSYALIPAKQAPESISVTVATGKIAPGSIENTDFSSFQCCARLGHCGPLELTLTARDLMSGRGPRLVAGQACRHGEPPLSVRRRQVGQRHRVCVAREDLGNVEPALDAVGRRPREAEV